MRSFKWNFVCFVLDEFIRVSGLSFLTLKTSWPSSSLYIALTLFLSFAMIFPTRDDIRFYKLHRTLHSVKSLWTFCHALHHKVAKPCMLDSGTIAPSELAITETFVTCQMFWPRAFQTGWELVTIFYHFLGHSAGQSLGR